MVTSCSVRPGAPGTTPPGIAVAAVGTASKPCPVIAPRAFVALPMVGRHGTPVVSALYDTGAQTSVLCIQDYHDLLSAGVPFADVPTSEFTLQAANGTPMPIERIIAVPVHMGMITATVTFVVTPGTHCSILGMNAITTYGLSIVGGNLRAGQSTKGTIQPNVSMVARLLQPMQLGRRQGKIAAMALFTQDGKRVRTACDAVLDTGVAAVLIRTDKNGEFIGPCSNFSQSNMRIPTTANVGSISSPDDYSFLDRTEACNVALDQPLPGHTPAQAAQVRQMLTDNVNKNTPAHHRARLLQLLHYYEDCFSSSKDDIGRCDLLRHEIDLDTKKPIFIPQFRLSTQHFAAIKDQLAAWIRAGIVRRTRSPYNNPVFCVPKPHNRGFRVVSDFRTLNRHTLEDKYSIPSVDQIIQRVGEAKACIFSSIDLSSGFYHVPLREGDEKYTAFTLPGMGQFEWTRAAMGLTGSPSSFCRLLDLILHDVDQCLNYVDDILCFSPTFDEQLKTLQNVLERLRKAGLRANAEKSVFATYSVDYLGHNLSRQGIRPTIDKMEAVKAMPEPRTPRQLDKVLGFYNYMSTFIYHYAAKCGPLFALRRKESEWKGGPLPPKAAAAFQQIKRELTSRPIVAFATADGPLHLYVDCALGGATDLGEGMGAALLQESEVDGLQRPISYLSRQLAKHEKNYPAGLGEFKAIAWALDKLAPYLLHRRFFLYCDNRPLVDLNTYLKSAHKRTLKHCEHFLENFFPIWRHIPGTKNTVADFLSRYHGFQVHPDRQPNTAARHREAAANVAAITHIGQTDAVADNSMPRIKLLQSDDPLCRRLARDIAEECHGSCMETPVLATHRECKYPITLVNGIVLVKVPPRKGHMNPARVRTSNEPHESDGLRFLTPAAMRREVLNGAHEAAGHFGTYKTVHRILEDHWWPGLDKDVEKHVGACAACLRATDKGQLPPAPMRPIPAATRANELISADLFGPVVAGNEDGQYVMAIVDAMTNHATLRVIPDKSARSVARFLLDFIWQRGMPMRILTDCGAEFNNELQSHLWTALQIQKTWTAPYYPSVNGRAEKMNDILANFIRKARAISEENKTNFADYLGPLALYYNTTVCSSTRISPHDALYGYNAKLPLWEKFEDIFPTIPGDRQAQDFITETLQRQLAARRIAYSNRQHQQEIMTRRAGAPDDVTFPMYQPREAVLLRNMRRGTQPNPKFNEKWEPGFIIGRVGPTTFRVCKESRLRRRFVTNWPAANIKPDGTRGSLDREVWKDLGGQEGTRASWDAYGYAEREGQATQRDTASDPVPLASQGPPPVHRTSDGEDSDPGGGDVAQPTSTEHGHRRPHQRTPDRAGTEHTRTRHDTPDTPRSVSPPPELGGNFDNLSIPELVGPTRGESTPRVRDDRSPSPHRPAETSQQSRPAGRDDPLSSSSSEEDIDIDATPRDRGRHDSISEASLPALPHQPQRLDDEMDTGLPPVPRLSPIPGLGDRGAVKRSRHLSTSTSTSVSTRNQGAGSSGRQAHTRVRRQAKRGRIHALKTAMQIQHKAMVAEARARLKARKAESNLHQQLYIATSGWLDATADEVLHALNDGTLTGEAAGKPGSGGPPPTGAPHTGRTPHGKTGGKDRIGRHPAQADHIPATRPGAERQGTTESVDHEPVGANESPIPGLDEPPAFPTTGAHQTNHLEPPPVKFPPAETSLPPLGFLEAAYHLHFPPLETAGSQGQSARHENPPSNPPRQPPGPRRPHGPGRPLGNRTRQGGGKRPAKIKWF